MTLILTLLAGVLTTVAAEAVALATAPYSGWPGSLLALGLALIAIGLLGFKDIVGRDRLGRAGIVLGFFGYAAFATTALLAMNAGVVGDGEIALTPFYLMSVLFMVLGFAAFALYAWRRESLMAGLPGLPVLLALAALLYLLRPLVPGWPFLHPAATLVGALTLGWIALAWLRRPR